VVRLETQVVLLTIKTKHVVRMWIETGEERTFLWKVHLQPHHSKGVGENFPLMPLNIHVCLSRQEKKTKAKNKHSNPVLFSHPKLIRTSQNRCYVIYYKQGFLLSLLSYCYFWYGILLDESNRYWEVRGKLDDGWLSTLFLCLAWRLKVKHSR